MAEDENFELIPHKQFFDMRKDMDFIKKNPFGPRTDEIVASITELSRNLDEMVKAFKEANELTQNQEVQDFSAMINPISSKVDSLMEQNKKIAQGVLAIADIVKDTLSKVNDLETKMSSVRIEENEFRNPTAAQAQSQMQPQRAFEEAKQINVPIPPPSNSTFVRNVSGSFEPPKFEPPPLPNSNSMQTGFSTPPNVPRREKKFLVF